ncbi:Eco57I restriction-modification methylase domain-containing protein [Nitratiruptor tergarcus]|uniref:site-specific DNA-methyltransferase (adenine-specific) n=1 Tax=Nitratiruptor tergarcus DSM 16512 TaxID=1069081 RepID=A0A1W1WRF5_9BACT|nr:Eco57I restriction-modification methylase domain-containing protein [Nitratiruptor tergarcus]SMC08795.1 Type II restriction/modification system, DNA methylase subunit YeeA [Nitratiruptor tergarcus DSM 16512]
MQMNLKEFLSSKYSLNSFIQFISNIFYGFEQSFSNETDEDLNESERKHIKSYRYLGSVELEDGKELGFFEFQSKSSNIENKRVGYNAILKKLANEYGLDGAIASFYHPQSDAWRLSFVGFEFDEGKAKVTNLKRYTYVLGENIPIKTAYIQLKNLKYPTFEDLLEAFGVERVTKEFYEKYRSLFEMLNDYLKNGQFNYFDRDEKRLHSFTKKLLGRIVFLYFLQKKGWLGVEKNKQWGEGDKKFLFNALKSKKYSNYFDDFLKKIFFEALNTKRENDYFKLTGNKLPFLNGGLFEKDENDKIEGLYLEDRLFEKIFQTFNEYNFTIIEDSPDDKEVAIDPEMMGRVFENFLEENYRKGKGAFYTPREIVHYMCQQTIIQYLLNYFPDKGKIANFVVKKITDDDYFLKYGKDIEKRLLSIKILDPAIGSGAFPMGMLHEIVTLLIHLDKTKSSKEIAKLKRAIIENSIYGIDIDTSAVEIAKLRFWLSLVVDEDIPTPLPNLYYKIMVGNSLLESILGNDPLAKDNNSLFDDNEKKIEYIQKLLHKFFNTNEQKKKENLKEQIETTINEILEKKLKEQEDIIKSQLKNINIFTGLNKKQQEQIEFAQEKKYIIEHIKKRPTTELFFYKIYFAEVLNNKGFDVVIGNPPYIRQEKIKDLKKRLQLERFYNPISKKIEKYECFTATADIYIYFFEKGYRLLKENALLSFITSNKYTRAKYGEKFRKFILENTQIVEYIDFNGVKVFESATVDTAILSFKKTFSTNNRFIYCDVNKDYKKGESLYEFVSTHGFEYSQEDLNLDSFTFATPKELAIKKRIEEVGVPLKLWNIKIYRGILTGFNEAFIIDTKIKNELIKQDPKSAEIIKPLLRGKDIKKYIYEWANLWLIATFPAKHLNIDEYPAIKKYLQSFGKRLEQSGEKGCRKKTKNKWFETQDQIAYWNEFEKEKIVWQRVTKVPTFCLADKQIYILDSMAFITSKYNRYLLSVLNSKLMYFYIDKITHQYGKTGYLLSNQFVEKLPVPKIKETKRQSFESIVEIILNYKKSSNPKASFFEKVIDVMVYELYFEKELKEKGFGIIDIVEKEISLKLSADELYTKWNDPKHPVKYNIDFIDSVEVVKTVEESL